MSEIRTVHIRVEGRVQGVGYRAWAESSALAMGLSGWVRNRRDRSVEIVVQGTPEAVEDFLRLCWQGPPDSSVSRIDVLGEGVGVYEGFEVRPTA